MPLSVFRGERDPGSRWTAKDAQAALVLTEYEAGLCPGCGQALEESTDPATYGRWSCEPVQCFACEAQDLTVRRVHANEDNESPSSYRYTTHLAPPRRRPDDEG